MKPPAVLIIALALSFAILLVPVYFWMTTCEQWYFAGFVQTSAGRHEVTVQDRITAYEPGIPFTLYGEGGSYQFGDIINYDLHPILTVAQCPLHAPYHTCEKTYFVGYVETSLRTYTIAPENRTVNYNSVGTMIYLYDEAGGTHAFQNVTRYSLQEPFILMKC